MKTRIMILICLLLFSASLFAQQTSQVPPKITDPGGIPITIMVEAPPAQKADRPTIYPPEIPALGIPPIQTASIVFQWDPMPAGENWQYVRIYERTGTAPNYVYNQVAQVAGNLATATITGVTIGPHAYIARSFNVFESENSNLVTTPIQPSAPVSVRITITIVVTP